MRNDAGQSGRERQPGWPKSLSRLGHRRQLFLLYTSSASGGDNKKSSVRNAQSKVKQSKAYPLGQPDPFSDTWIIRSPIINNPNLYNKLPALLTFLGDSSSCPPTSSRPFDLSRSRRRAKRNPSLKQQRTRYKTLWTRMVSRYSAAKPI